MTPTAHAFLLAFRRALWETAARPLVELRRVLPSLADVAESVRLAAAAEPDFWGFFATAGGTAEVARAVRALQEGSWPAPRDDPYAVAADVCRRLRA